MLIKEIEKLTGISSKNIRFYEKEGLLNPTRNEKNKYREYKQEDIIILKQIKLLRKFDISLNDIKTVLDNEVSIGECLEKYIAYLELKKLEINKAIDLCKSIKKDNIKLSNIDLDAYLEKIDNYEKSGFMIVNIALDWITKAKSAINKRQKVVFEPNEPIMNRKDFTNELILYAMKKDLTLTFLEEGMYPLIILDGIKYKCILEAPRWLEFPFSPFFINHYGCTFVSMYLC